MTHTYAIAEVSANTFVEVAAKLREAGYDHAFHDDVIDMHGIALRASTSERRAADLSAEEVEALRWLLSAIAVNAQFPMFPLQSDENRAACRALAKLIAAHGSNP